MPLLDMTELLKKAKKEKYGVGAFSIANMEMIMGTIKAAEEFVDEIREKIEQSKC